MQRISQRLLAFLQHESAAGFLLIGAAALALVAANSPLAGDYAALLGGRVAVFLGGFSIDKTLLLWINDGLMAVFFFLIGLEVKREVLSGQLASWRQAALPVYAAIGGMALPALIFVGINWGEPDNLRGWAIPAATDIAFALGVLTLLGKRVPVALKAFLLAVAIIDDIGAIAIIALFYTADINLEALGLAAVVLVALLAVNRMRVAPSAPYVLLSILLWVFVLKSGVHATLAGVAAALLVPMHAKGGTRPLERMEHALHPWVAYMVLPIFAFANAGVSFAGVSLSDLAAPLPLGIAMGLLVGKQLGVFGFAYGAVKLGLAVRPAGTRWIQIYGIAAIAGIGFTMSLFIGGLGFSQADQIASVKLGVLAGSLCSAIIGYAILRQFSKTGAK